MPFMRKLNLPGTLAMLSLLAAGTGQAATLTVDSNDIVWDSSGTGSARIRYNVVSDAYFLNDNTSSAWVTSYGNGLYSSALATRAVEGDGTTYLCDRWNDPASLVWKFAVTGQLIQGVSIKNVAAAWDSSGQTATVQWLVSTDGNAWTSYKTLTSTPGGASDSATYDLTSYVKGTDAFYIKAILTPGWQPLTTPAWNSSAQVFRSNFGDGLDLLMTVPEPASLGLLALGALGVLRRRRC